MSDHTPQQLPNNHPRNVVVQADHAGETFKEWFAREKRQFMGRFGGWIVFALMTALAWSGPYLVKQLGAADPAASKYAYYALWAIASAIAGMVVNAVFASHQRIFDERDPEPMEPDECASEIMAIIKDKAKMKRDSGGWIYVDVIGLSLSHSKEWIDKKLLKWLKKSDTKAKVKLRLVFTDANYLSEINLKDDSAGEQAWAHKSEETETWIKGELASAVAKLDGRLEVYVRKVPHIPQWHGTLIQRAHLFMGRVNFPEANEKTGDVDLTATCADNGYRHYHEGDQMRGADRIDLFRRWLAYLCYANHPYCKKSKDEGIIIGQKPSGKDW